MKDGKKSDKFTVLVRVKPQLSDDSKIYKASQREQILQISKSSILINRKNNEQKIFKFNRVFSDQHQSQIYTESSQITECLFEGYNSCFLAYGQTGTGKTHTIFGRNSGNTNNNNNSINDGIFYRSVNQIFEIVKERMHSRQFSVRVSFLEFYLDGIFDLIDKSMRKLEIKQTLQDGIHIKELSEVSVKSVEELFNLVKNAIKLRKTQQTSINKRSSRSHAIIQIALLQRWNQNGQIKYLKGLMKIVDLAGSERVSKTQSFGARLQQAKRINRQITALGKCINLLAIGQKQGKLQIPDKFNINKSHIPFRDSKITRYLSEALTGKSKVVLCVCISRYNVHLQQTFSSLLFATQASTLKVQSIRNQIYTISKSLEAPRSSTVTPTKIKNNISNLTNFSNNSHLKRTSTNDFDGEGSVSSLQSENRKQQLVQKFNKQIDQIDEYIKTKKFKAVSSTGTQVQRGFHDYQKIFKILRDKYEAHFQDYS